MFEAFGDKSHGLNVLNGIQALKMDRLIKSEDHCGRPLTTFTSEKEEKVQQTIDDIGDTLRMSREYIHQILLDIMNVTYIAARLVSRLLADLKDVLQN